MVFHKNGMLNYAIKCYKDAIKIDPKSARAKKKLKKAKVILIESNIERLRSSWVYHLIGVLAILYGIALFVFFLFNVFDEIFDWRAFFESLIFIVIGVAWIGLETRFKALSDYIEMKDSND